MSANEKIKVVTLVTDPSPNLYNWIMSAQKLNYEYTILAYGEKWGGWSWRTKKYIEHVKTIGDNEVVLIVDGNDIIFIEDNDTLLSKFKKSGKKLILGGEPACCVGKYNYTPNSPLNFSRFEAMNRVEEIKNNTEGSSRWAYPNAGCIIGYKKEVLNLLIDAKDAPDDQALYLEKYLADPSYLSVDYNCDIVANINTYTALTSVDVPLHLGSYSYEENYFGFRLKNSKDIKGGGGGNYTIVTADVSGERNYGIEFFNKITGATPSILHFPGKGFAQYNRLGKEVWGDDFKVVDEPPKYKLQSVLDGKIYKFANYLSNLLNLN